MSAQDQVTATSTTPEQRKLQIEEIHKEFNEKLDTLYLEFLDRIEEIKKEDMQKVKEVQQN